MDKKGISCTMYHKSMPVLSFTINEKDYVTDILDVTNETHIPVQFLENCQVNRNDRYYNLIDKILVWKNVYR